MTSEDKYKKELIEGYAYSFVEMASESANTKGFDVQGFVDEVIEAMKDINSDNQLKQKQQQFIQQSFY